MIRIGINGLGRVGRTLLRQAVLSDDIQVVGVNDVADIRMLRTLLRRDSTFGPFPGEIEIGDDALVIGGHKIPVFRVSSPAELPWGELAVDVAVECTGKFRTGDTAGGHLEAGARKVVISAPGKDVDATFVMGVNDHDYQPAHHDVVSNASCTTNCVAPMVKVLHDAFGVQHGFMSTVHAYTGDQNLLDAPHKDARRARSAAVNIVPTTTGAAKAVGEVLPELAGRLDGVALRVPVVDGSLVDLAVLLDREVTVAEVNAAFEAAAATPELRDRLRYEDEPFVSVDVIGDSASCVFDSSLTQTAGSFVKVFGWYDNEWGYTARLLELTRLVGSHAATPSGP
ncbi:type I glyceraldehyde-3-phosphate dehydrogenase [Nocardioides islandensis]|jgi:glyceraldehyde 3-phosphate dehydrogenase|uniref:Type I glyceraldehyde-3-phosphate dehydrogenase n=1 Tax=Nocardioides islandensis TaxID=433663 RepID=A0A930VDI0_9ACTN|nr:type I glyceraldehyde-3-phosphate dehydrogenase [Nocardioides islandensis]MBF4764493.1 type I glyceraldehyde-3-phosphate dehydrogenase [Nocardioides islandensis]